MPLRVTVPKSARKSLSPEVPRVTVSVPKVTVPKSAKSHGRGYASLFWLRPTAAPCNSRLVHGWAPPFRVASGRSVRTATSIETGTSKIQGPLGPAHARVIGGMQAADSSVSSTDLRTCRSYGPCSSPPPESIDVTVLTDLRPRAGLRSARSSPPMSPYRILRYVVHTCRFRIGSKLTSNAPRYPRPEESSTPAPTPLIGIIPHVSTDVRLPPPRPHFHPSLWPKRPWTTPWKMSVTAESEQPRIARIRGNS